MANLERGVRRLTWVAALCFAVPLVGFGLLSTATGNTRDGGLLVILGLILAALSWIVFFTLRWIVGGFGNTGASEGEEDQESNEPVSWWRHLLQPVVKPFCFSYYNRPHCGHPCVRKNSWGVYHVICGNPPVERVDVKGLEETLNHLKSGDPALAEVLPHMLSATIETRTAWFRFVKRMPNTLREGSTRYSKTPLSKSNRGSRHGSKRRGRRLPEKQPSALTLGLAFLHTVVRHFHPEPLETPFARVLRLQ